MKYVAFLDILGFKNKLKSISQSDAKNFIESFSSTVYDIFQCQSQKLNGYIVSDSIILHTEDTQEISLNALVQAVVSICKNEFSQNGILIRGAIAKGEFDDIPAKNLPHLKKRLMVGQAYIDAYLLEGSVKAIGINLSEEVYNDLRNYNIDANIIEEKTVKSTYYILRYITLDFLLSESNMVRFIQLASSANWLPHYYNALYFALKREKSSKKVDDLFHRLLSIVCEEDPSTNWRAIDTFIKNSFQNDVLDDYQTRFLKYIRNHII